MTTCPKCQTQNDADAAFCINCREPLKTRDTLATVNTPDPNRTRRGNAPSSPSLDLEPGAVFAERYTIVERIGQGGMGVVYRATESLGNTGRDIALKLIRADRLADDKAVDQLVHEGMLTQNIRHPNVVAVYNVGVAEEKPFVAMEYVEGVSLRAWIRSLVSTQQEASLQIVATLLRNILDGLAAAHQIDVVHRDLKPENIILLRAPQADNAPLKILDFGIARAPGTIEATTGTGVGTPNYMAPEQITNPTVAGPSADLYSLSVIFYELLMGVLPTGYWQPPSGGRGDVPESVDKLIQDGLSNRQMSRPQTTDEYRQRLDAIMADVVVAEPDDPVPDPQPEPTPVPTPPPPPPPPPPGEWSTGKKWAVGAGAAAVLVIGLSSGGGGDGGGGGSSSSGGGSSSSSSSSGGQVIPPDPPPVTPQRQPVYTDTSGTWDGTNGVYLDVVTYQDGTFEGDGIWTDGFDIYVNGSLATGVVNMQYANGQQFLGVLTGGKDWCHVRIDAQYPNGSSAGGTGYHIGHSDGEDCPLLN